MTEQVTVQRLIPAPAEAIFDLLADPGRHHEIDGSGTIVGARSAGERRLALGDSFGMDMDWGVNYATKNVVVEFEENRRIAWQTLAPKPLSYVLTGRIWRYELEPVEGGTIVRETWDTRQEALPSRYVVRATLTDLTRRNMDKTLKRIEDVVTA
ncbi:MAG: SRPBCC family protein [Phycicoccus sp.]|uniref:SRPBCC family protein n=1 Tax=Phycicoccus sp. TaxID=1902410 RepID=UPI00258CC264|nr:SRPBCC family protein [Phycicoccus sp.]MCO5302520.1 SRPBCC family protein [Phycicoccus sp.]